MLSFGFAGLRHLPAQNQRVLQKQTSGNSNRALKKYEILSPFTYLQAVYHGLPSEDGVSKAKPLVRACAYACFFIKGDESSLRCRAARDPIPFKHSTGMHALGVQRTRRSVAIRSLMICPIHDLLLCMM